MRITEASVGENRSSATGSGPVGAVLGFGAMSVPATRSSSAGPSSATDGGDVYFSVDIETDGPIPGPYSLLSFAMVPAGAFRHGRYVRPEAEPDSLYLELRPISEQFDAEALAVNRLDRERLRKEGLDPSDAMAQAAEWIADQTGPGTPVLVAYPLSFDWSWLYWYFMKFAGASPFKHSRCFDIKTAIAVKGRRGVARSGHRHLPEALRSAHSHTHHALEDAIAQADTFAKLMEWDGS